MRQTTLTIFLAIALASAANAGTPTRDIDRFVSKTLQALPDVPGVAVAIVRNGKPYYAHGYGYRDVANRIPTDARTGYYIASNTKAFTALACAILASRGVLDLDAPITKYLPEVRLAAPLDAEKLTLRKFLSHTSEIENTPIVFRTAFTGEHSPELLVRLLNSSTQGKPGFHYDNLGYVVASVVMERVTGKPWQSLLAELVFKPIGMKQTTAFMSVAQRGTMALPYEMNRKGVVERTMFVKKDETMHAAGGIVTTANDLERWLEGNVNLGRVGGKQVIPAVAFREVQRQQVATEDARDAFKLHGYGFGWYQADFNGEPVLYHGGGYEGWRTHVSLMPEKKNGVAVTTNFGGFAVPMMNLIASYVYDRLANKPDVDALYADRLAKFVAEVKTRKERGAAEAEKRSKRPSMLQHPTAAYVGRYESPTLGTLLIQQSGETLTASLGPLSAVIEAYTEPESARVELAPGSGEVLRFTFTTPDHADSVKWSDVEFKRMQ